MYILSDAQIDSLISETKPIPPQFNPLGVLAQRNNHERKNYKFIAPSGNMFYIFVRRSLLNVFDFSVILGYQLPNFHSVFRLRRYNGRSHYHTNVLEKETFYDYHIHTATERYQIPGFQADTYAVVTDRYQTLESAIPCLLDDCGFRSPTNQLVLDLSGKAE